MILPTELPQSVESFEGFDQWSYKVIPVGEKGKEDGMGVVHLNRSDKQ